MMHPALAFSLVGAAFLIGAAVGWYLKSWRTAAVEIDSYNCATMTVTVSVTGTAPETICADALDNSAGTATQPLVPGSNAVAVAGALGSVNIGPLTHENGATKVLVCVWGVDRHDTRAYDCSSPSPSPRRQVKSALP